MDGSNSKVVPGEKWETSRREDKVVLLSLQSSCDETNSGGLYGERE